MTAYAKRRRPDVSTSIGPIRLANPVLVASGTFGGIQDRVIDVNRLGGVVAKTVTMEPRKGNPPPRVWETASGMLNSIGLDNKGLVAWIDEELPHLSTYRCRLIVSVSGRTAEEYGDLVGRLSEFPRIDAFELNISCPNVSHGMDYGTDPALTEKTLNCARAATKKPLIAKLTPNVTDVTRIAEAALAGGADALSLVNTLKGMAIDWRRRAPCLGGVTGGLSGPAIKPVALRMVWEVCSKFPKVPVVGIGGISTADDALEFIAAGACAVQVGTANFAEVNTPLRIVEEMPAKLAEAGVRRLRDLVGTAR
ncbi:MAG: dihydroorotate dehydrogenase [Planctomycetes bacterium]|nr:dihydroorotate dehydrogenase [Planctomycetota bacterium]